MRTTVRPRTSPLRYGSKCVGSSSKSIVRTWSCTRSGRHSTASLFQIVWRSAIGSSTLSDAQQMDAAQDERHDRRVELHVGGEARPTRRCRRPSIVDNSHARISPPRLSTAPAHVALVERADLA